MKLYCVRHGEAMSGTDDQERCLSAKGEEDITKIANYLSHHHVHVHHILVSDKRRAKQTAAIFQQALAVDQVTATAVLSDPEGTVDELVEMISSWHDDTMLIGHMPFLSHLVSALVVGNDTNPLTIFPPGNVVCLEQTQGKHWIINWLLHPGLVSNL